MDNRAGPSNVGLDRVVAAASKEIERLGYSRRSRTRYGAIWTHFIDFSRQNGAISSFSSDLAAKFVERCGVWDEKSDQPGQGWRPHAVFGIKVLADFVRHGRIERRVTDLESIDLAPALQKGLEDYQQYARDRLHLRPSTLEVRSRAVTVFLDFLSGRQVSALGQMQACHLSEFVSCQGHLSAPTVSRLVSDVRSFLRFLTLRGILQKDLALEFPRIRFPKDSKIPSVWDQDLIVKLLGVIDRSSPKGKRDYAILLLACRLGLRAGDIRRLKLDDLHWEESRIEVVQSKTCEPLSLALTEEVGAALIDYLRGGRPQVEHREVFLKANSPFEPFPEGDSLYHIVSYWRQLAGVRFQTPRKRGLHSLRHSLAARLLELGTPFPTIADILGHSSLESMWKPCAVSRWTWRRRPMPNEPCRVTFQSILAPVIEKFLEEKRACGYGYHEPARVLQTLDRFCLGKGLTSCELTRFTAREWLALKPHESAATHQARVTVLRQFSKFLCRVGHSAYVPILNQRSARRSVSLPAS